MLPVQRHIDGLWHCLRPAFTCSTSVTIRQTSPTLRELFRQNSTNTVLHYQPVTRKTTRRKGYNTETDYPKAKHCSFSRCSSHRGIYGKQEDRLNGQKSSTPSIYDDLRRSAIKGDLLQVHAIVKKIVQNQGEEPNSRLFHALILANTDPRHGSPAEVRRLLDEMAREEIVPDSAIYHAVIKVGQWIAFKESYLLICNCRFLRYIPITFCVTRFWKRCARDGSTYPTTAGMIL